MEKRLSRKVKLDYKIDKSVIAGMITRAGDLVIDGSIRGRLERLTDVLQSWGLDIQLNSLKSAN